MKNKKEIELGLKWYYFIVGSNIDRISRITFDPKTNELKFIDGKSDVIIKVESEKIDIITRRKVILDTIKVDLWPGCKHDDYYYHDEMAYFDYVYSLIKEDNKVFYNAAYVVRKTSECDSIKLRIQIDTISDAVKAYEQKIGEVNFDFKEFEVDEKFDFMEGQTSFRKLIDICHDQQAVKK